MKRGKFNSNYARIRIVQFVLAEIVLFIGLYLIFGQIQHNVFWPLTIGLALPTLFGEPYFTAPRPALFTAVSQIGTYFASNTSTQTALWILLVSGSSIVGVSAVFAIWKQQGPNDVFHWIATRFGRPIVLGSIVSLALILQASAQNSQTGVWLAILLTAVYFLIFQDWSKLWLSSRKSSAELAMITSVIAPNQLQISTFATFEVGQKVEVESTNGKSTGYVAEELASDSGSRYRVILDKHWRKITNDAERPCIVNPADGEESKPKGFAIEGSTESIIRLNPVSELKIGQTLETEDSDGKRFYQVAGLELREEIWAQSAAIVPRATLVQVGALNPEGNILVRPALPAPYQKVTAASDAVARLGDEYMRIGVLKGTKIPVGIKRNWESNLGHLGVLGMSGMGKTTAAAKLANLANAEDCFVMLDETSEYRTRLGHNAVAVADLDWNNGGVSVCEPGGDLPTQCRRIVDAAMEAAHSEYAAGETPRRRFILLEEAHGWLPEWNFTTNALSNQVNQTSRYILQARKFNLTFIMVSQRTAVISKSAISQCENYLILRTLDQTSLEYVEGIVGQQLKKVIPELQRYEAICAGPIFNSDSPIIVSLDP